MSVYKDYCHVMQKKVNPQTIYSSFTYELFSVCHFANKCVFIVGLLI